MENSRFYPKTEHLKKEVVSEVVEEVKEEDTASVEKKRVVLMTGTQMERPLRYLAGLIKEYLKTNYEVYILNLGTKAGVYEQKDGGYPEELKKEIMDFLIEKKPEVIGISMIDFGMDRIAGLIKEISENIDIQNTNPKIIAGGPAAIEHPEKCLDIQGITAVCYTKGWHFADIVEACSNDSLENIPGLMIKTGVKENGSAEYTKTSPPNLRVYISDQPLPDESLKNTYRIYEEHLVNAAESGGALPVEHHQVGHKHTGVLVTSEGCPNDCKFCSIPAQREAMLAEVSYNFSKVKFLEAEQAIALVKNFLKENPKTEYMLFNDNDFTARGDEKIKKFAELYKKEIGLPFYCQGSPNTIFNRQSNENKKIEFLVDAGMDTLDMGVQGSEQSNKTAGYDRGCTDEQVIGTAGQLARFLEKRDENGLVVQEGLKVAFDFINGNEVHTKDDMLSTIGLIKSITNTISSETENRGSWNLAIHNLTLDPDRELAREYQKRKIAEGISVGEVDDSDYHNATVEAFYKLTEPYLNILLEWMGGLHNQVGSGRLPKQSKDFIALIADVLNEDQKLSHLLSIKKDSIPETIDLLTENEVYEYLGDKTNLRAKEVLKLISEKIPEIYYSYQRPNRYDFDYSWADKQIAEKVL